MKVETKFDKAMTTIQIIVVRGGTNVGVVCLLFLLVFVLSSATKAVATSSCRLKPTRFKTNNLQNPLAIVDGTPVFSWAIIDCPDGDDKLPANDKFQSAYRVVCRDMNNQTNVLLWDSGKVLSRETLQIEYTGTPLQSLQRVQWKVQIWDELGDECLDVEEDELPWFETGLLDEASWGESEWIARFGPVPANNVSMCTMMDENNQENQVPRFRAILDTTTVPYIRKMVQARAYISGMGYSQLYINGNKVGDSMLDPGWTSYSKRVLYSAHDITSLLLTGNNNDNSQHVVGVELGNGWWNPLPMLFWGTKNLRVPMLEGQKITSSRPMFRLSMVGFLADGSTVSLLKSQSGPTAGWKAAGSPTTLNNIYLGERYDARLEPAYEGWSSSLSYDDGSVAAHDDDDGDDSYMSESTKNKPRKLEWKATVKADASGIGKLEAQETPPIRRQKTLTSTLISTIRDSDDGVGVGIVDTGVNHAGLCRLRIDNSQYASLTSGKVVRLRYGEFLNFDGSLNVLTSTAGAITTANKNVPCQPEIASQEDIIILGSTMEVDWTPSWSWRGFRYIEVTVPPFLSMQDIKMDCFTMRTDVDAVANFTSSDPWLSDMRQLVRNTYDSNMMSIQSDCPHRERFGYGGDVLGCGEAGLSMYDFSAFYRKRVRDFNDAQVKSPISGKLVGFTETSPYVGIKTNGLGYDTGPIGWETFQPEALLWLYKYYGDTRTMKESYEHTKAYIELLDTEPDQIEHGLGDWLSLDPTDVAYTGRGFQYMSYLAFANITEILGMPSTIAAKYRQKAASIVSRINSRFLNESGAYQVAAAKRAADSNNVTQTGQAMALFHGFIANDKSLRRKALEQLAGNARSSSHLSGACRARDPSKTSPKCKTAIGGPGAHITAGLFGIKWLLMALAEGGENDLAYEMVTTKTFPSLRWMTSNDFANATTIWETWGFSDARNSHNHPMFSSTEVWLLQTVAGIQPHPAARGMDHILIKPNPPSQLQHASASFESPRGVTSVSWKRSSVNGTIHLSVTIPPNCRATVYVPAVKSAEIFHNDAMVSGSWIPSVTNKGRGSRVFGIGNGYHVFRTSIHENPLHFDEVRAPEQMPQ